MRFLFLIILLLSSPVFAGTTPYMEYIPKNGGPPVPISSASRLGVVGKLSVGGLLMSGLRWCVALQCWNMQPSSKLPVPFPSRPPNPNPDIGLPITTSISQYYVGAQIGSPEELCRIYNQNYVAKYLDQCIGTNRDGTGCAFQNSQTAQLCLGVRQVTSTVCKSGYIMGNNGVCYLQWQSDNTPTVFNNGTNFDYIPNDLDTFPIPGFPSDSPQPGTSSNPVKSTKYGFRGSDQFGNPQNIDIQVIPNIGIKIQFDTQSVNPNTAVDQVHRNILNIDLNGLISESYQILDNINLDTAKPSSSSTPQVNTTPVSVNFPSDLATESTQQDIRNKLNNFIEGEFTRLDALKSQLESINSNTQRLPAIQSSLESLNHAAQSTALKTAQLVDAEVATRTVTSQQLQDIKNALDAARAQGAGDAADLKNEIAKLSEPANPPPDADLPRVFKPLSFDYDPTPGSCPPNPYFEWGGTNIEFPLSFLCSYASDYFRPMAVALALLCAVYIVVRD